MKQKLTRALIDEIRKEMPVLNEDEEKRVQGGWDPVKGYETLRIAGGFLQETGNGTWYYGEDGKQIFFEGIGISTAEPIASGTAFQVGGVISISQDWLNDTRHPFTIKDFAHEYGHYLQELEMGSGSYWKDVAIPSGYNLLTDPGSHDDMPYEQDATKRGNDYMDSHTTYPSTGYGTPVSYTHLTLPTILLV